MITSRLSPIISYRRSTSPLHQLARFPRWFAAPPPRPSLALGVTLPSRGNPLPASSHPHPHPHPSVLLRWYIISSVASSAPLSRPLSPLWQLYFLYFLPPLSLVSPFPGYPRLPCGRARRLWAPCLPSLLLGSLRGPHIYCGKGDELCCETTARGVSKTAC